MVSRLMSHFNSSKDMLPMKTAHVLMQSLMPKCLPGFDRRGGLCCCPVGFSNRSKKNNFFKKFFSPIFSKKQPLKPLSALFFLFSRKKIKKKPLVLIFGKRFDL
jgi:hypothetical protein